MRSGANVRRAGLNFEVSSLEWDVNWELVWLGVALFIFGGFSFFFLSDGSNLALSALAFWGGGLVALVGLILMVLGAVTPPPSGTSEVAAWRTDR